ncbi:MAG TPA: Rid family hydrolase [Polyangiales bacterium]
MNIERKNYPALALPAGPYAHAVEHNGLLYVSGLTAFGTLAQARGLAEQAEAAFAQLATIASNEHVSLASLLKVTLYVTTFEGIDELRAVLTHLYGRALPASSIVQVAGLFAPELRIEVEAILALR